MQDLRHAFRVLAQSPTFAGIVVLTLALGIGANTAIFTVVDQVLLRPLPLRDPDQLIRVQEQHHRPMNLTGAAFHDLHERSRTFGAMFAYRVFTRNVTDARQQAFPEQVDAAVVTQDFFSVAGERPVIGRAFSSDDFREGAALVVLLSDRLWRHMFGGDPNIIGHTILFHGEPAEVAGVMPAGFSFPENVQAWSPVTESNAVAQNRRAHLYTTIGRLKPGYTPEQARVELQAVGNAIEADNHQADPGLHFSGDTLRESMVGEVKASLLILLGAVGLVLLIACGNVANLLLARAVGRQKDLAIRTALGASRAQLVRFLLLESLVLSLAGGALGVFLGKLFVAWIAAAFPGSIPRLEGASLDWRIVLFAVAASLVSAVVAGLAPAWQFSHLDPLAALNASSRSTESKSRRRVRLALLVSEIALAVVLLAGAGLLIRSFVRVQEVNPGYDPSHVAVVPLSLPGAKYESFESRLQFTNASIEKLRTLPGVRSVAATGVLPLRPAPSTDFELVGKPLDPEHEPSADVFTITPDYLQTMNVPLLSGRGLEASDRLSAPTVVLINRAMADAYYRGENPVGHTIIMKDWGDPLPAQIVGVVGDVRQQSMEAAPKPAVYFSFAQFQQGTLVTYLVAKTDGNPSERAAAIRGQIWAVDRQQPVEVTTMETVIAESLLRRRFMLTLLGSFSAIALLLAAVGVYGVISYTVSQRTQEFGIRMAIGAQRVHVLKIVMTSGMRVVVLGMVIGLGFAFVLTRALRSLMFGVSTGDPITFVVICGILVLVAMAACLAPALRATRVDPMVALRYE